MRPTGPVRTAAIDVGSNAMRLLVAEFASPHSRAVLHEERAAVRLGHDVFRIGRIGERTAESALAALAEFRERMEALSVGGYRAVATSAVREAANRGEFLHRVRRETGVRLELISGSEEARIVHRAVRRRVPPGCRSWFHLELGGGSAELSLCTARKVLWSETHGLGAVRLLETFSDLGQNPSRFRILIEEYLASVKMPPELTRGKPEVFVATGGNIEALAKLCGTSRTADAAAALPLASLRESIDRLAGLSPADRVRVLGLREDRADVILPAALVYERIVSLLGFHTFLVPAVGVRDGIVQESADRAFGEGRRGLEETVRGAVALGRKYRFDEAHALRVSRFALELFDWLPELHGMGHREKRILAAAAVLHDAGMYIGVKDHHKNSGYLISRSELPGFSPHGMKLTGLVARYHRKAEPCGSHPAFASLTGADRTLVSSLAALLRIADALDREHKGKVRSLHVESGEDRITVRVEAAGDLLIERWALERKGALFEKVFGTPIRIAREDDPIP